VARSSRTRSAELAAIEAALIRIRRRQSRRALGRAANDGLAQPINLDHVAVLDALEEGLHDDNGEVTVGDVADRLGIDPSRASRLVTAAINTGYVQRIASQSDGRRTCLTITAAGQEIIEHAHRSRRALIDQLLHDWSASDRAELARLLTRLTEALVSLDRA
jgi:DNA-binding MarR family transcriptional regulator